MKLEDPFRKLIPVIFSLLLIIGIFLRFYKISEVFSDVDDICPIVLPYLLDPDEQRTIQLPFNMSITINKDAIKTNPLLYAGMISKLMTYAPLQYLTYPLFLSGDYSYRDFLLRGRLPSAIFGTLALLTFCLLCWNLYGKLDIPAILGICLFSFSLMNIIYSQQTVSYSTGVFSASLLMFLIFKYYDKEKTQANLCFLSIIMALLSYSNYQIIFLVPAVYASLFYADLIAGKVMYFRKILFKYGLSIISYGFFTVPLYVLFLREKIGVAHLHGGIPGFENYFPRLPVDGFFQKALYVLMYSFDSLYIVVETNILFSTGGFILTICTILFFMLFLLGSISLCHKKDLKTRTFGVFIFLVALIWAVMNIIGRFPLSPTRHILVLTPMILFMIISGTKYIIEKTNKYVAGVESIILILVFAISVDFITGYGSFREARKDRFDENMLANIMSTNEIDTIAGYEYTYNPAIMFRNSNANIRYIRLDKHKISERSIPSKSFMLISHNKPVEDDSQLFILLKSLNFKIRHVVDIDSDTQVGVSRKIKFYTNGLYISIAER